MTDDMPPVHIDRALNVTRPPLVKGRDYWLSLRGDRLMPARGDVSPRDMRTFLSHVGLIEFSALPEGGEDYFVRLIGGKVEEVFGPLTGQFIGKALPVESANRFRLFLNEVRKSGSPLVASGRLAFNNLRHLKQEMFVAPLGEGGDVRVLFAVMDIWSVI